MADKPTYEELEQRVKELEKGAIERKQLKESLREEKEFATSLIDNTPIFFVAIDAQGKTMRMNQHLLKVLGYTTNEVVGKDYLSNFVPERDRDMLASVFRKLTVEQEHTLNENHILSKDGKEFLVEWYGTPVFDTSSKLQYFYGLGINITERKKAEEALRESEERHRLLLEVSPDPIVLYGIEGKTIYVNPAFEQTFGWSLDELREKRIDFVPEENWPETKEAINRMLQGLKIQLFETRRLTKDGRILDIQLSSSLIFDRDEKPTGNIVILRDITVQKRAERTLRKAHDELEQRVEERTAELVLINENLQQEIVDRQHAEAELKLKIAELNSFINNVPAMAWLKDTESRFIAVNSEFAEAVGMNPESLINHTCEVCFGKEEAKKFREDDQKVMKSTRRVIIEEKITDSQKNEIWLETIKSPIFDESGKVLGTVGIARDITKRMQTEEALRESEKRYRAVVENQTEMICRFLPDGTLTFVNEAYCRYFGKNRKELTGQNLEFLIPEDDRKKVLKNILSLNQNDPIKTHEHRVLNPNGEICWHRWTNRAIFDDQNVLKEFQSVGWDITERVRAEKALRESEKRYRRLVETMNDGIGIQDASGLITYVNNKFSQMLGYKPDEFIGKPVTNFLDDHNSQILKNQTSIRRKGKVKPYEIEWTCKDGRKIQTIMSPQAIFNDNGQFKGSFSVITDISILKQVEKELRKAHDELESRVEKRTRELKIQKDNLEEANIALQVLLEKRQEDKKETEDNVLTNVKELVGPYIEKIKKTKLDDQQKAIFSIIESNLNEIISPFTRKMSLKYLNLTPTEIQVANKIRHGFNSKEIAELMSLSPRTIYNHRKNIRKKFGLEKKKTNLRSHLLSTH